jgi:hypothetical protein
MLYYFYIIINIGLSTSLFYINLIVIYSDSCVYFYIKQPKLFNATICLGGLSPHARNGNTLPLLSAKSSTWTENRIRDLLIFR